MGLEHMLRMSLNPQGRTSLSFCVLRIQTQGCNLQPLARCPLAERVIDPSFHGKEYC